MWTVVRGGTLRAMSLTTIAAVSLRPGSELRHVERVIGLARRRGAQLVVLPEAANLWRR